MSAIVGGVGSLDRATSLASGSLIVAERSAGSTVLSSKSRAAGSASIGIKDSIAASIDGNRSAPISGTTSPNVGIAASIAAAASAAENVNGELAAPVVPIEPIPGLVAAAAAAAVTIFAGVGARPLTGPVGARPTTGGGAEVLPLRRVPVGAGGTPGAVRPSPPVFSSCSMEIIGIESLASNIIPGTPSPIGGSPSGSAPSPFG